MEHEQVAEGTYNVTCRVGAHPIELQRHHIKESMKDMSWLGDGEQYQAMMAFQGLCNLTRFERGDAKLSLTMENPCLPLMPVGMVQAMYELATGSDESTYWFERAPDRNLTVEIDIP